MIKGKTAPLYVLVISLPALGCVGKEEVEGTPVGSCSLGGSQWDCTSPLADASGSFQQCPANVGAGVSCVINNSDPSSLSGPSSGPTAPGFQSVFNSDTLGPCLQCTSNGRGVVWTCTSQVWEAGDVFSCRQ